MPFASGELVLDPGVAAAAGASKAAQSSIGCLQSTVWTTNAASRIAPADRLFNFHRRMNKVMLDSVALNKEKERLERENADLQDLIAQYISGTRITDSVLRDDNPIFVVNGRYGRAFYVQPTLYLHSVSYIMHLLVGRI